MNLISGLGGSTDILQTFKNEAIKILNEIATKQADELVQGIIREQVTKNMETIFNSGYVQQAAASAFNSTIYPEYIRRLKNLEAFLKISAEQDNGLRDKINALPADQRTAENIIPVIQSWADGLEPKLSDIQAKMVGPKNTDFNVVGNISDILYGDRQQEDANNEKITNANTLNPINIADTATAEAANADAPTTQNNLFSNVSGLVKKPKTGGKKHTKRIAMHRNKRRSNKFYKR